jgi:hypothetical protein
MHPGGKWPSYGGGMVFSCTDMYTFPSLCMHCHDHAASPSNLGRSLQFLSMPSDCGKSWVLVILGRLGGLVNLAIFQDCIPRAERLGLDELLSMDEIGRFVPYESKVDVCFRVENSQHYRALGQEFVMHAQGVHFRKCV